ncbi:MAG: TetR/AcrR family transcriptional regulator [Pseudomonas sp.]|nr:TetR/AcrR family transcriptional regulator [Pseudomonas sp.]
MSRYKGKKAEVTRSLILESAARLFAKYGVSEVSISKIMADVGLTNGGFYKYFDSKEMLAIEVCDLAFGKIQGTWEVHSARARQTSEDPYRYLVRQYLSSAVAGECALVALSLDAVGVSDEKLLSQLYCKGTKALLNTLLRVSLESGSTRTRDDVLVHFAAMLGTALLCRTPSSGKWVQEVEMALSNQLG